MWSVSPIFVLPLHGAFGANAISSARSLAHLASRNLANGAANRVRKKFRLFMAVL